MLREIPSKARTSLVFNKSCFITTPIDWINMASALRLPLHFQSMGLLFEHNTEDIYSGILSLLFLTSSAAACLVCKLGKSSRAFDFDEASPRSE